MKRYRIHFVASFDHVVEAADNAAARAIAEELQTMPRIAMTSLTDNEAVAWNTIEPLGDSDD